MWFPQCRKGPAKFFRKIHQVYLSTLWRGGKLRTLDVSIGCPLLYDRCPYDATARVLLLTERTAPHSEQEWEQSWDHLNRCERQPEDCKCCRDASACNFIGFAVCTPNCANVAYGLIKRFWAQRNMVPLKRLNYRSDNFEDRDVHELWFNHLVSVGDNSYSSSVSFSHIRLFSWCTSIKSTPMRCPYCSASWERRDHLGGLSSIISNAGRTIWRSFFWWLFQNGRLLNFDGA